MKTAIISFYTAYPPTSGAAVVTYSLAKYFENNCLLINVAEEASDLNTQESVRVISLGGLKPNRLKKALMMFRWIREIIKILTREEVEIIFLEGASWVLYQYFLIKTLRKHLPTIEVVYHSHNVEYLLRSEKQGKIIGAITHWAENRVLNMVDCVTAVSVIDQSHFYRLYGITAIILPNGVDLEWLDNYSKNKIEECKRTLNLGDKVVIFMGSYLYKPNQEGIDFLINDVFPELLELEPASQLLILGGEVPYKYDWLITPGVVDREHVPQYIRCAAVSAAPIISGSGTRMKILDSLACCIPVVCTKKAMEGLALLKLPDVVNAEDAISFARKLFRFLQENKPGSSNKLSGYETVRELYAWPNIVESFKRELQTKRMTN